jgi:GMP synthase-like glutamine amidotransferase
MNITGQAKPDLPEFSEIAGLVIMGGPMGATDYENYPGLKKEAKLARAAISVGKPVIGVCLGQQIIATALGAKLASGAVDEVGFAPIKRLSQHDYFSMWSKQLNVLHWHHDVVGLPEGAEPLARSEQTKVQAFRIGSALAMQFHLEVSAPLLEEWLAEPTMVKGMKKSQIQKIRDDFNEYNTQLQPLADSVFSGFAARCSTYAAYLEDGRH